MLFFDRIKVIMHTRMNLKSGCVVVHGKVGFLARNR